MSEMDTEMVPALMCPSRSPLAFFNRVNVEKVDPGDAERRCAKST